MALENFDALSALSLFGVFIMMTSFASALDLKQLMQNIKKPKGLINGIICQYIFLPFMAFLIATLFQDSLLPEQSVGLVIMGTMPGGTLSNFFCFLFGADLTLSIAMTTASSLSSFIFITINGLIYIPIIAKDTSLNIDYISLALSVVTLICGVLTGLLLSYKDNNKCISITKKIIASISAVVLGIAIVVILILNFLGSYPLYKLPWAVWIAPLMLAVSAWFVAFAFAVVLKLERNSQIAVAIECANQNAGFASAIMILTLGHGESLDIALGIPMLYSTFNYSLCLLLGFIALKIGYLTVDENDRAVSCAKILHQWRSKGDEEIVAIDINKNEDQQEDISEDNDKNSVENKMSQQVEMQTISCESPISSDTEQQIV